MNLSNLRLGYKKKGEKKISFVSLGEARRIDTSKFDLVETKLEKEEKKSKKK